jgi:uncharacterized protein (UPF0335 family)
MPRKGHNNPPPETGGIAAERLRSIVERIERLTTEKQALQGDISDVFAEAKSAGFDHKAIRTILRIRKQEPAEVEEQRHLVALYGRALGMDTGDEL